MQNRKASRGRVALGIAAAALMIVFVVLATRSRPPQVVEYEFVYSDSVPDPRAVGMCALGRDSGKLEGVIIGLVQREGSDSLQFRVQSRENPSAEYVMEAARVQVVRCEDTVEVAIRAPDGPGGFRD